MITTPGPCERTLLECTGLIIGGDASMARKHMPIVSPLGALDKHEMMTVGRDCETESAAIMAT